MAAWRSAIALLLSAAVFTACFDEPKPPELAFRSNPKLAVDLADAAQAQATIQERLTHAFGTPGAPRYPSLAAWSAHGLDPNHPELALGGGGSGEIDSAEWERLAAEARAPAVYPSLARSAELYRQQCAHCHGIEGGGDGPTASFLEPRPRDFRKGIFKFTAQKDQAKPRRADLLRTLELGLKGTSMPSFARFSLAERNGLVDYVRFLSIRGEVELRLAATFVEEEELADDAADTELELVWSKWEKAGEKLIVVDGPVPAPSAELLARGDALFHDVTKGNCSSCHGDHGRGDGPLAYKYKLDGTREPAYLDAWDRPILPRDLGLGHFRGGSRPIDLYRRIYAGIPGGPMPAIGESKNAAGELLLSSEDVWAIVHYVRNMALRAEDAR